MHSATQCDFDRCIPRDFFLVVMKFDERMQATDLSANQQTGGVEQAGYEVLWRHARHLMHAGADGIRLLLEHLLHDMTALLRADAVRLHVPPSLRERFDAEMLESGRRDVEGAAAFSLTLKDSAGELQIYVPADKQEGLSGFAEEAAILIDAALLRAEQTGHRDQVRSQEQTMMRELHHRTKNNLQTVSSLLDLQGMRSGSDEMEAMLNAAAMRVRTIAIVHDTMCQTDNGNRMNLRSFALGLILALRALFELDGTEPRIDVDVEELPLDYERATPCALILNELLCNAFKHAFRDQRGGRIAVRARRIDKRIGIVVSDNGIGLPSTDSDALMQRGFGFTIIRELANQIGAELTFKHDKGFECRITFLDPAH